MLKKLDAKSIIIIILASLLVVFIWLEPNKKINYYKNELKALKEVNIELLKTNDSLKKANVLIDNEIKNLHKIIEVNEKLLIQYNNEITDLKKRKNEIPSKVNILNADMVAIEFTNYFKRRKSGSNPK
jgi:septal ring factor EnvC (AmiA/AmiB activator)